jgi:hypothetical protein
MCRCTNCQVPSSSLSASSSTDPLPPVVQRCTAPAVKRCLVDGCNKTVRGPDGWCKVHLPSPRALVPDALLPPGLHRLFTGARPVSSDLARLEELWDQQEWLGRFFNSPAHRPGLGWRMR